ncbi:MAG TPA: D-alanyl-D-alanine carboxypeptidase family protein [Limnochordales bacterium]
MFIPTRWLRGAAAVAVGLLGLLLLLERWVFPAAPVWVEPAPGPGLVYLDGHDEGPNIRAGAAILIEAHTGTVLFAHNEHERRPMASTTKIMTALVTLENARLDELATVSSQAVRVPGSDAGLRAGQTLTVLELLHGLLLPSGNDAANVLAEHVAGSQEAFVRLMNERAAELGASRTRFANAHGLDAPDHYSTAYDLALVARTAMLFPTFSQIVRTPVFQPHSISRTWRNTNQLLWAFEGIEGVKTGTTSGAGYCLVAAASRSGMRLIAVVLASPDRYGDAVRLLEYGFDRFHMLTLASHGSVLARVRVPGGLAPLEAVVDGDFRVVARDADINRLQVQVVLEDVRPPIAAGQVVGRLEVAGADGRRLQLVPLVAKDDVARWTPLGALWRWLRTRVL